MSKQCWLLKTEPEAYSIDDLQRDRSTFWHGIRNYQARNFLRDSMKVGDDVLIYHSNADPTGVVGVARISKAGYPDHSAFDKKDVHFDPKSDAKSPTWYMVDVAFVEKFKNVVTLEAMKANPALEGLLVIKRGQRLSVQPVSAEHFRIIREMAQG